MLEEMGYETFTAPGETLRAKYREQFPVTERLVYLNHAGVAPLSRRAAEAMKQIADDVCLYGSLHYDQWLDAYEGVRVAAAALLNADRSEIAIVKNTSEGISMVAQGFPWKAGDRIVAFREEFPANYFPWKRLENRGVTIDWLSCTDDPGRIDEAARGARLLAISYVQYLSGFRADLESIGRICRDRGVFFFVDALQGLGVFPVDVRRAGIHALSADGHKWLLGPEGCGILFLNRDLQEMIEPVEFGWTNIAGYNDYSCRDMTLRQDAGRYECGTLNTVGCYGLRAAIELILEMGVEEVGTAVQALGDQLAGAVVPKGYQVLGTRTPGTGAGIVSFRKDGIDARLIVRKLKDAGFIAAPRQGWVRVSPHFYITPEEIDRLAATLP
jgi:selenocysteine lyase/cysteine desulfurase